MCLATSFLETQWLIAAVAAISKLLLNSIIHLLGLIFPMAPLSFDKTKKTAVLGCCRIGCLDTEAENLGFEDFIPPFSAATCTDIISGVNYASGSPGIRDETGQELDYPTSQEDTSDQSTGLLLEQYKQQLRTLNEHGARKTVVFGLGQLGCNSYVWPTWLCLCDSLVDSSNNNHLKNKGKVNYLPYGIDFPDGPTGRFNNGRTVPDVLGELMGFKSFIKSFPTAEGSQILEGVNYGSGYAGIRDETGKHMYYNSSRHYTPKQYANVLVEEYARHLKTLHDFGARKLAIIGVAPIGCTPNATAYYGTNGYLCVKKLNKAAILFNELLKLRVQDLNNKLIGANFIYLEIYEIIWKYVNAIGTKGLIKSCCQVNDYGLCIPSKPPCLNRNLALFWDSFHPSEFLNLITGTISYNALRTML
ncbi:hypothetical protein POTOM_039599 [Populus tomentosa]|uniref:Uncharacterized protein n=1 Tax=Populus tomentosa TaxID=118781 RepID=A0A8X8CJM6_POPTO|nr:hypothetical protein POTOM_039599 [Populus tomentosa]